MNLKLLILLPTLAHYCLSTAMEHQPYALTQLPRDIHMHILHWCAANPEHQLNNLRVLRQVSKYFAQLLNNTVTLNLLQCTDRQISSRFCAELATVNAENLQFLITLGAQWDKKTTIPYAIEQALTKPNSYQPFLSVLTILEKRGALWNDIDATSYWKSLFTKTVHNQASNFTQLLLDHNKTASSGDLAIAIHHENLAMVNLLLSHGVIPELGHQVAAQKKNNAAIQQLIDGYMVPEITSDTDIAPEDSEHRCNMPCNIL